MSVKKSWFEKHWKSLLYTVTAVFAVFYIAVFAGVWEDRNYTSNFWPNFWLTTRIVIGVILVAGWCYLWFGDKRKS